MRPNVLVFLTDDHAQWAADCYGNSELRTPSLDHLAASGVRMRNAYTPTPVCSPARATLFTGRLPSQHGMHDYLAEADPDVRAVPWLHGEYTLADAFHDAGYTTGMVGKWHMGRPDVPRSSFDYWYAHAMPVPRPSSVRSPWTPGAHPSGGYNRHLITDRAVEFLRNRDSDRPFFLYVGHFATHSPWAGHPERLVAHYRRCGFADIPHDATYRYGRLASEGLYSTRRNPREALAQYYAAVHEIDEQVGRVLDELSAQDILNDTLVVYTSDHGLLTGHHGIWGKGNSTRPYNMLEESIRVPLLISRPGAILGGQIRDEPVTHCDLFPTVLDHAGIELPSPKPGRAPYPGRSFHPLLLGQAIADWPDTVYGEYGTVRMIRTERWKLIRRHPDGPDELYDLLNDRRETRNLLAPGTPPHPVTETLSSLLDSYFVTYEEPEQSGLRVTELPRHNNEEAWRDPGAVGIEEEPLWLNQLLHEK